MTSKISIENQNWSTELETMFKQLQDETILLAIPGVVIATLILLASIPSFSDPVWGTATAAGLCLLAVALYFLRRVSFLLSALTLAVASTAAVAVVVIVGQIPAAIFLLILPVGLTTLTLGVPAGVGFAVIASFVLILNPFQALNIDLALRTLTAMAVWSVVGMIWLTLRPLVSAVQWAWDGYEHSQVLLEKSRDYQQKMQQSIEDLTNANVQLTRLNQLAQSLRHFAEEERRAKEQFVANVSHELRTPLNMIVGFCETILQTPESYGRNIPSSLLADLDVVLRNSQHLASLIDDVLDLSQIDAGQMALTKENSDLSEIIAEAVVAVRPLYESKGLYLRTQIPPEIVPIFCDRTRIREVLLNLLSNAGRFTEEGGVTVSVTMEENSVVVAVRDTGRGISDGEKSKLFRPFAQLDGSIHRRYGGTGLGLSISKSFVELHDGKMWVESTPGVGSTFSFRLPIVPPAPLEGSALRWFSPYMSYEQKVNLPDVPPASVPARIVMVESGNTMQRIFNRYLENCEVVAVPDLRTAMTELAATPARALMINDLEVGKTLERLLETDGLPFNIPAVICSIPGAADNSDQNGVFDYLTKPISREALLKCLDRLPVPVKTILIVDDEPDALLLYRRILTNANRDYRVLRAGNGLQALEILKKQIVDVILLDLMMPEINGFQFLSIRSQDAGLQNIPVILISARDPQGYPIASNAFAVTRGGGLSIPKLLACIEAVNSILAPMDSPTDLKLSVNFPD